VVVSIPPVFINGPNKIFRQQGYMTAIVAFCGVEASVVFGWVEEAFASKTFGPMSFARP